MVARATSAKRVAVSRDDREGGVGGVEAPTKSRREIWVAESRGGTYARKKKTHLQHHSNR